jgi:hypothetical protein
MTQVSDQGPDVNTVEQFCVNPTYLKVRRAPGVEWPVGRKHWQPSNHVCRVFKVIAV